MKVRGEKGWGKGAENAGVERGERLGEGRRECRGREWRRGEGRREIKGWGRKIRLKI